MTGSTEAPNSRQGLLFVAPTTDEPILIKRLSLTAKIPVSRVVLANETAAPCEQWTKDYNHLLAEGAPARALLGLPEKGGCRLVVSADIDHGKSWMMPVAAAHLALAMDQPPADRIATARALVWTTGVIGLAHADTLDGARIIEDDYHLKSKAERSRQLFADAAHAGTPVICLLPNFGGEPTRDAAEAATWLGAILKAQPHHIRTVSNLAELEWALKAFMKRGRLEDMNAPPPGSSRDMVPVGKETGPQPREGQPAAEPSSAAAEQPAAAQSASTPQSQAEPKRAAPEPAGPVSADRKPAFASPLLLGLGGLALVAAGAAAYVMSGRSPSPPVIGAAQPTTPQQQPQLQQAQQAPPAPAQPRPQQPAQGPSPTPPSTTVATAPAGTVVPPAGAPVQNPPAAGSPVARLVLLTAPAGRNCRSLVMDMQPRFDETVQMLQGGQGPVDIDTGMVCGVAIAGHEQVTARFASPQRDFAIGSLSTANRWILNPSQAAGDRRITIELGGAQTGQITLQLR